MPTLAQYRQEAIRRSDPAIGSVYTPTSFTTRSAVVEALIGAEKDNHFVDQWIVRAGAASTADRIRQCIESVRGTGTLVIQDVYADTTVGTELLEVYRARFRVQTLDEAVNQILHMKWRRDAEVFATYNSRQIWLDPTWIAGAGGILRVGVRPSPVLNRNRRFTKWNLQSSTGVLQPDDWTISGGTSTMAREATIRIRKPYSLAITYVGAAAVVSQNVWDWSGISANSLRGKTVTVGAWVRSANASSVRLRVYDGVDTSNSAYHTGNSVFSLLTQSHTVNAAATELTISVRVEVSETAYVNDFVVVVDVSSIAATDAVLEDNYHTAWWPSHYWQFDQSNAQSLLWLPTAYSWGQQIIVETRRPWFVPTTRIAVDTYSSDAPLEIVAEGVLWLLYKHVAADSSGDARKEYLAAAEEHRKSFDAMAARFIHVPDTDGRTGMPLEGPRAPFASRR